MGLAALICAISLWRPSRHLVRSSSGSKRTNAAHRGAWNICCPD
jgi:hypothetical protein